MEATKKPTIERGQIKPIADFKQRVRTGALAWLNDDSKTMDGACWAFCLFVASRALKNKAADTIESVQSYVNNPQNYKAMSGRRWIVWDGNDGQEMMVREGVKLQEEQMGKDPSTRLASAVQSIDWSGNASIRK